MEIGQTSGANPARSVSESFLQEINARRVALGRSGGADRAPAPTSNNAVPDSVRTAAYEAGNAARFAALVAERNSSGSPEPLTPEAQAAFQVQAKGYEQTYIAALKKQEQTSPVREAANISVGGKNENVLARERSDALYGPGNSNISSQQIATEIQRILKAEPNVQAAAKIIMDEAVKHGVSAQQIADSGVFSKADVDTFLLSQNVSPERTTKVLAPKYSAAQSNYQGSKESWNSIHGEARSALQTARDVKSDMNDLLGNPNIDQEHKDRIKSEYGAAKDVLKQKMNALETATENVSHSYWDYVQISDLYLGGDAVTNGLFAQDPRFNEEMDFYMLLSESLPFTSQSDAA